jgi:excinuclease ABC subunit B
MKRAIGETDRRRRLQAAFNKKHCITPQTIVKSLGSRLVEVYDADYVTVPVVAEQAEKYIPEEIPKFVQRLKKEMKRAADNLEFEKAAELRDRIRELEERELGLKNPLAARGA